MKLQQNQGEQIPNTVIIIAFSDGNLFAIPVISAINQHDDEIGRAAVQMHNERIEIEKDADNYKETVITTAKIKRESTLSICYRFVLGVLFNLKISVLTTKRLRLFLIIFTRLFHFTCKPV